MPSTPRTRLSPARLRRLLLDVEPLRRFPAFRRLWISTVITAVGSQLTAVAVPQQLFDDTGSSAVVGLSALAALVPLVVFGLYGGTIADVVDRRVLLLVTGTGLAVTSLLLWLQALAGLHSVALLLVLLALQQALFGVDSPAHGASVPRLVPGGNLAAAIALTTTVTGLGQVAGPLLAGALIPVLGLPTLYLLDTIALASSLFLVWRLPAQPPLAGAPRRAGLRDVLDGFRYIGARGILLISFLADVIAMVFGMPRALFPELAERTFGDPAGGGLALGVLYAAIPVGALVGGLFSGALTRLTRHGRVVALAVCAWGVAIALFGLTSSLLLAAVLLALAGAADFVSSVFRSAILQANATDEMRGRMQGVFLVVVAGGPRLADLLHGVLGDTVGTRVTVTGGGVAVVVAMVVAVLALPRFWAYRAGPTSPAS